MARIVVIGTWGSLKFCDLDEEPPEGLRGALAAGSEMHGAVPASCSPARA
jgi:hypothetical protein